MAFCSKCGATIGEGASFCSKCGAKATEVKSGNNFCQSCGSAVVPAAEICVKCGVRLIKAERKSDTTAMKVFKIVVPAIVVLLGVWLVGGGISLINEGNEAIEKGNSWGGLGWFGSDTSPDTAHAHQVWGFSLAVVGAILILAVLIFLVIKWYRSERSRG